MTVPGGDAALLHRGTAEYRRASSVIFAAGFMTFALLYVVQGILPALSRDFGVSAATASLTLSLTTMPLAVMVVISASWSEGQGRRPLLVGSLMGAAVLAVVASASPSFGVLLGLRVLTGRVLAGFPAAAMAYVAEEFHPSGLGTAMGLYISGTGLGGMTGRLLGAFLSGWTSWRVPLLGIGALCVLGSVWVAFQLPRSRNFVAAEGSMRGRLRLMAEPARDRVVVKLALCGFVIMGSLVSYFNYLQYRLALPPFTLPAAVISLVFGFYVFGAVSANWMGRLTDRRDRRSVMMLGLTIMATGALLSLSSVLALVLLGTAAMVFGFFGTHSVASGFVGAWSVRRRAQASALYLFGYHFGSSVVGYVGGLFFGSFGWGGEVGTVLVLLAVGAVIVLRLPRISTREEADVAP
jgi:YNFM family putative membrane transporter